MIVAYQNKIDMTKERLRQQIKLKILSELTTEEETTENIMQLIDSYLEQLSLCSVSKWVAVKDNEPPEVCTDVMVKYKDGRKEVAYFDGDYRFYIEKDDRDVSEMIVEWHKLP